MGDDTVSKAHTRINHVDETVYEIKDNVKENSRLIQKLSIDVTKLKTEMRIGLSLLLGALGTIITLGIVNLFTR